MQLRLYRLVPTQGSETFITARSPDHAAEIYVVHEVANDRQLTDFQIERVDQTLTGEQQLGLNDMLEHGVAGIARFDPVLGWGAMPL